MAVLSVMRWTVPIGRVEAYSEWAKTAIPKVLTVPGLKELRAYRAAAASDQVLVITEFDDMRAWAEGWESEAWQELMDGMYTHAVNVSVEIWGPSPFVPEPLRPK